MTDLNTTVNTNTADNAADKPKLSRRERLVQKYERDTKRLQELQVSVQELYSEIKSIDDLANVDVGTAVLVTVGRAETTRQEAGVVLAVREDDDGTKLYKVQYGAGFDTDIAVVRASKIAIPAAQAELPIESAAE